MLRRSDNWTWDYGLLLAVWIMPVIFILGLIALPCSAFVLIALAARLAWKLSSPAKQEIRWKSPTWFRPPEPYPQRDRGRHLNRSSTLLAETVAACPQHRASGACRFFSATAAVLSVAIALMVVAIKMSFYGMWFAMPVVAAAATRWRAFRPH